jgi:hypothetical protein
VLYDCTQIIHLPLLLCSAKDLLTAVCCALCCAQVGNRQKDTMTRLAAFTSKLRTSGQQQQKQDAAQEQQDAAAAAADEEKQQQQDSKPAAEGSKAAAVDEAYDGKVRLVRRAVQLVHNKPQPLSA